MTISEQIIQVIDALCEKFGIPIDWTSENVIPYVTILGKKLVTYEIMTSIIDMVATISLLICGILLLKKFTPTIKAGLRIDKENYTCGWEVGTTFIIIGMVFLSMVTIINVGIQVTDIVKCLVFPEMYIFEYIQALIK